MLSEEIEMLMTERARLLRVAGAAAQFVAVMESRSLPETPGPGADTLAGSANALPAETPTPALDSIRSDPPTA